MRGKPSLIELSNSRYQWRAKWQEGGKVRFRYFRKGQKEEAKTFLKLRALETVNHGTRHGSISDDERAAIIRFREATRRMPDPKPTLNDCVDSFLESIANQLVPITVSDLVADRISAAQKKGVHRRTLLDLGGIDGKGGRLGFFAQSFGERQAATIKGAEIESWANEMFPTEAGRREALVRVHGLFSHAVKRKHIAASPFGQVQLPRPSVPRATILSVSECANLLAACPGRSVPAVAVQLFAGLRHAEVERLRWEQISFEGEQLRVTQHKGTGRRREIGRHVDITPALKAWLEPYLQSSGPIFPTKGLKGQLSSQAYRTDFAKARKDAGITKWDENTLRHCFGSYRLAATDDLKKTSVEMGHSTEQTTKQHYLKAVTRAQAREFWELRPNRETGARSSTNPT